MTTAADLYTRAQKRAEHTGAIDWIIVSNDLLEATIRERRGDARGVLAYAQMAADRAAYLDADLCSEIDELIDELTPEPREDLRADLLGGF